MRQLGEWTNKCWGKTRELIESPFYSKYELQLIAGGYCSIHYHQSRANRFYVVNGSVEIIRFFGPTFTRHMLGPDNMFDVPSLVPHMFIVYGNGVMYEEYYPDRGGIVEAKDITRLIEGSKVENLKDLSKLPMDLVHRVFNQYLAFA